MPLELHVWGPGFGLPSIDAECLATIAYLRNCEGAEWELVQSSDPSICPSSELPALRNGSIWVSRFSNIISYLAQQSEGKWDLDRGLSELQVADSVAFSAFLTFRAHPLIDLSLYVSSENYNALTRPALSEILTWPSSWTVPHRLRAAAKTRSAHLGLSSLDIDAAPQNNERAEGTKTTAQIPRSLRKPRQMVSSLLGKSGQREQFRLEAVTSELFAPLEELMGGRKWLLGTERLSSLDCLVIGYLSLIQVPNVPHDWLRRAMSDKYSLLNAWFDGARKEALGNAHSDDLPWRALEPPTMGLRAFAVLEQTLDAIPLVGDWRNSEQQLRRWSAPGLDHESRHLAAVAAKRNRDVFTRLLAAGVGCGTLLMYLIWAGTLRLPGRRVQKNGRRDFGAAGAMLGI